MSKTPSPLLISVRPRDQAVLSNLVQVCSTVLIRPNVPLPSHSPPRPAPSVLIPVLEPDGGQPTRRSRYHSTGYQLALRSESRVDSTLTRFPISLSLRVPSLQYCTVAVTVRFYNTDRRPISFAAVSVYAKRISLSIV